MNGRAGVGDKAAVQRNRMEQRVAPVSATDFA